MVGLFIESLRGDSPGPYPYQNASMNGYFILLQACGEWTTHSNCQWSPGDNSPANGFEYGNDTFGTTYFEIYRNDIENPAFEAVFTTWHTLLNN
jgi:hypothetical protein